MAKFKSFTSVWAENENSNNLNLAYVSSSAPFGKAETADGAGESTDNKKPERNFKKHSRESGDSQGKPNSKPNNKFENFDAIPDEFKPKKSGEKLIEIDTRQIGEHSNTLHREKEVSRHLSESEVHKGACKDVENNKTKTFTGAPNYRSRTSRSNVNSNISRRKFHTRKHSSTGDAALHKDSGKFFNKCPSGLNSSSKNGKEIQENRDIQNKSFDEEFSDLQIKEKDQVPKSLPKAVKETELPRFQKSNEKNNVALEGKSSAKPIYFRQNREENCKDNSNKLCKKQVVLDSTTVEKKYVWKNDLYTHKTVRTEQVSFQYISQEDNNESFRLSNVAKNNSPNCVVHQTILESEVSSARLPDNFHFRYNCTLPNDKSSESVKNCNRKRNRRKCNELQIKENDFGSSVVGNRNNAKSTISSVQANYHDTVVNPTLPKRMIQKHLSNTRPKLKRNNELMRNNLRSEHFSQFKTVHEGGIRIYENEKEITTQRDRKELLIMKKKYSKNFKQAPNPINQNNSQESSIEHLALETLKAGEDLRHKTEKLIACGRELSDIIVECHVLMNVFLSFYNDWKEQRIATLSLFQELHKNLSESCKRNKRFQDVAEMFGSGGKIIALVPDIRISLAGKVVAALSSVISTVFRTPANFQDAGKHDIELMLCLRKDIDATTEIYENGIRCAEQFKGACEMIEEFHNKIKNGSLKELIKSLNIEFLNDLLRCNPSNPNIYYRRLQKLFEHLMINQGSEIGKEFCRAFEKWPDAISTIGRLHWRFRARNFNSLHVQSKWEEIFSLQDGKREAVTCAEVLEEVQKCVTALIEERSAVDMDIAELMSENSRI